MRLLILSLVCLALSAASVFASAYTGTCCCTNGGCYPLTCVPGNAEFGNTLCNNDICASQGGGTCSETSACCAPPPAPEFTTIGVGVAVVAAGGLGYWLMRKNKK